MLANFADYAQGEQIEPGHCYFHSGPCLLTVFILNTGLHRKDCIKTPQLILHPQGVHSTVDSE